MTEHIKKEILIKLVKQNEEIYSEIHLKARRYDYDTYFMADGGKRKAEKGKAPD